MNGNTNESTTSTVKDINEESIGKWAKIGLLAAVSAAAGGMAAIWLYRETVKKLHETVEFKQNPDSHNSRNYD